MDNLRESMKPSQINVMSIWPIHELQHKLQPLNEKEQGINQACSSIILEPILIVHIVKGKSYFYFVYIRFDFSTDS